jgi:hypothetical protein
MDGRIVDRDTVFSASGPGANQGSPTMQKREPLRRILCRPSPGPGIILQGRRTLLCTVVLAGLSLVSGRNIATAQDIDTGLTGYWPFSDINDSTLADYSGNGHTGSFTGRPVWTVGKISGALRFNGQSEYVATSGGVVNTSQSFTAAAWVQLDLLNSYSTALSQDGNNVSGFFLQVLSPTDTNLGSAAGKFAFALLSSDSTGANPTRAVSPFGPVTNTWYHLAGVYDATNLVIKLYVNGVLVATQSVPAAWNAAGPAAIGRGKFGQPSDFWPGRITDARLYQRALSVQDIQTLYQTAPVASPLRPPAVPLIVRGPYINTWEASDTAPGTWPTFWNGRITAITGIARIDGVGYTFFGAPSVSNLNHQLQQTQLEITPTQSRYVFQGGGVTVYLTFLSPVDATDLQRLSMPFGYMTAQAETNDGNTHNVSLYFDISGEWAYGDSNALINWGTKQVTHAGGTLRVHTITPNAPQVLNENSDYPSWGTVVWATNSQTGFTWQSGADAAVRSEAISQGFLNNSVDSNQPRAINNQYPVFAFNFQLNNLSGQPSSPIVFALGHVREPAVSYLGKNVAPLWKSYWSDWENMLSFAYDDVASSAAYLRANNLDNTISDQATQANGPHYAGLCALALRQAFGGVELVGNTTRPWLFLKEISSSGNVSTVDVIYPSIPAFLYTNPYLIELLLDPVLTYTESGKWPALYCVHDLGAHYPNASGHNDGGGENMPVEESANMLLMATAYLNAASPSDAAAFSLKHYKILKQWADYLVPNTLDPGFQNQTDDFTGFIAHSSNLALKGILAVDAMSQIARYAGKPGQESYYSQQGHGLITQWVPLSEDASGLHLKLAYDMPGTWSLKYNAFPDKLLGLDLIPAATLQQETSWYLQQEQPYGIPLDIRHTYTKADWELWTAASTDDPLLRQNLVDELYSFANTSPSRVPLTDWYDTISDNQVGFQARPVIGGVYSILARLNSGN